MICEESCEAPLLVTYPVSYLDVGASHPYILLGRKMNKLGKIVRISVSTFVLAGLALLGATPAMAATAIVNCDADVTFAGGVNTISAQGALTLPAGATLVSVSLISATSGGIFGPTTAPSSDPASGVFSVVTPSVTAGVSGIKPTVTFNFTVDGEPVTEECAYGVVDITVTAPAPTPTPTPPAPPAPPAANPGPNQVPGGATDGLDLATATQINPWVAGGGISVVLLWTVVFSILVALIVVYATMNRRGRGATTR